MDEYINYIKTLLVHGYKPEQIRALLQAAGVDERTMQALAEYMESTIAKHLQQETQLQRNQLQNVQHRSLSSVTAAASPIPQDFMHTDYVKKNFEFVIQQASAGKSSQEISAELSKRGVDDTTKSILLELASRNAHNLSKVDIAQTVTQKVKQPSAQHQPVDEKKALQRKTIKRLAIIVAALQPLGVLPQLIAVYGHHNASGVAISTWIIFVIFDAVWAYYGYVEKQKPVFITGLLFMFLELLVVIGVIMYGGSSS